MAKLSVKQRRDSTRGMNVGIKILRQTGLNSIGVKKAAIAQKLVAAGHIDASQFEGQEYALMLANWYDQNRVALNIAYPPQRQVDQARKAAKKGKKTKHKQQSGDFLSSWEWTTLRYKMLDRYGRRCMCCGATPDDGITVLNVDHIKPRHTHPHLKLDPDNLQVLCHLCNKGKGAWDATDFRSCEQEESDRAEEEFQKELADTATIYQ